MTSFIEFDLEQLVIVEREACLRRVYLHGSVVPIIHRVTLHLYKS